jgi:hypothetical protein
MSRRDKVPVDVIEERLRDAFTAAGETVQDGAIRGLPMAAPPGRARVRGRSGARGPARAGTRPRAVRGRARGAGSGKAQRPPRFYGQVLAPLAAATAVALITTTMTVIVPKLLAAKPGVGGRAGGHPVRTDGATSTGYVSPGFAAMPRFFVGIRQVSGAPHATALDVYSPVTGRVVSALPPLRLPAGSYVQAVAALGNDRTFVAAVSVGHGPGDCHTVLWRFTLTAKGQPTGLRPLPLPELPGKIIYSSSFAASADGRMIAYAANSCTQQFAGQVVVVHLATATVRTWDTLFPSPPYSLSLTANGTLLGFVSGPDSGRRPVSGTVPDSAWVLRTGSRPGSLASRDREVPHVPKGVSAAVLGRTGATLLAVTPDRVDRRKVGIYVTATGRRIQLMRDMLPGPAASPISLAADVSGEYAIVYGLQRNQFRSQFQELNVATGRLRSVPINPDDSPFGVAW